MKTQRAIELAGGTKALAQLFGISPSAISQWGDEVPEGRVWQLRVIKPEWFKAEAPKASKAKA
jgi:DNA-binding transcriptional regulator YdaS (Cro superfamily)